MNIEPQKNVSVHLVEKSHSSEPEFTDGHLKLDKDGIPLSPQPSESPNDPLNWSRPYKYYVVFVLCLLAFCVQFGAGMVPAAFHPIATALHVTQQQASYLTTTYVLFGGITPLAVIPFLDVYGRRPAYVIGTLIAVASNIGSTFAASYGGMIVSRCFVGVGTSISLSIGGATIADMFFQTERGFFIGLYALALTNGPHFGPIAGGFIAKNQSKILASDGNGWRWIFVWNIVMLAAVLILLVFTFPETLYSRIPSHNIEAKSTYWGHYGLRGKVVKKHVRVRDFVQMFKMFQYITIILPCIYYMTANTYGSVLFVLTASSITTDLYNFNTAQNGLLLGIPLTVGCLVGESFTGWVSDWLVISYARKNKGQHVPERRLHLAWITLLLPAGLIIHGVCVQHRTPWIGLAMGMFVCSIGTQAATTLTYAYCIDCFRPWSAEVSMLINFARQIFAFSIGFYALPAGEHLGFQNAWIMLAFINVFTWFGIIFLIFKGKAIRTWQGVPNWHKDL